MNANLAPLSPTAAPHLSIIIVSYNTAGLLVKCLTSVYAHPHSYYRFETIIIDNASSDNSLELVRQQFPQAQFIANQDNRGFAAATNQGLTVACGQYLLLLNPDTEILDGALWKLLAFLEAEPEAAVAGPSLIFPDYSFQDSAFYFPGLWQIFLDFFPLNWRLLRSRLNGRYSRRHFQTAYPQAFEIDFPLGACLMVRRSVLEQVGPLDPAFFMYMEEIDWCYRIKQAWQPGLNTTGVGWKWWQQNQPPRWKAYCLPAVRVIHHAGASTRQFRAEMQFQLFKSRAYFYKKHYSRHFQWNARQITRLGITWSIVLSLVELACGRMNRSEITARLKTYRRIWRLK